MLLRAGASAKAANVYGLGPIHCAAACRRAGACLVELLIVYGADPDQSTGGGRTPLHAAAQHGHTKKKSMRRRPKSKKMRGGVTESSRFDQTT